MFSKHAKHKEGKMSTKKNNNCHENSGKEKERKKKK